VGGRGRGLLIQFLRKRGDNDARTREVRVGSGVETKAYLRSELGGVSQKGKGGQEKKGKEGGFRCGN